MTTTPVGTLTLVEVTHMLPEIKMAARQADDTPTAVMCILLAESANDSKQVREVDWA